MLELRGISVRFGDFAALDDVDLVLPTDATTVVLGPSGSGKTTLLRVVAGLQPPDQGTVLWNGTDVTPIEPHRRNFGLMFQDLALFPHRDVWGNVAFGLHIQGRSPAEIGPVVRAALNRVGLSGFEERSVGSLSGGEAQRVALARALAPEPELLMFDEPLGSLDRELRERLAEDLRVLLDDLAITAVYVTHDRHEALTLADHLVVMQGGRVVQAGVPGDVWDDPRDPFVARFLGMGVVVDVPIAHGRADLPWGSVEVPATPDGRRTVLIREPLVTIDASGPLRGAVKAVRFGGSAYRVTVAAADGTTIDIEHARRLSPGDEVRLAVPAEGIHIFD